MPGPLVTHLNLETAVDRFVTHASDWSGEHLARYGHSPAGVKSATTLGARPARRPAALQLVAIDRLFRLVVPCRTPRGTHPEGRPTAVSRIIRRDASCSYPRGTAMKADRPSSHNAAPALLLATLMGLLALAGTAYAQHAIEDDLA